jgi:hypothetical protein
MSNENKGKWSWRVAMGRATGNIFGTAIAGGVAGAIFGGPPGGAAGIAIGAAGSFVNGFMGYTLGHWWDDPPDRVESFGSGVLYTTVVSGSFMTLLFLIALGPLLNHPDASGRAFVAIPCAAGFLGAMSKSLLDDLRATQPERMY